MTRAAGTPDPGADARAALHRPFRPRAARYVSTGLAGVAMLGAVVLVVLLPRVNPGHGSWGERVAILTFGAVLAGTLLVQARVRATPDDTGLAVRNGLRTRHVAWTQVVSVRFGQGRPWVQLDLADGGTLAVVAVQEADGAWAATEARRLATLVALHSATDRDT